MVLLRQTGLVIGAGGMYSNFKGYIDEVGNKMTKKTTFAKQRNTITL